MFVNPYLYFDSLFGEAETEPQCTDLAEETSGEEADDAGER